MLNSVNVFLLSCFVGVRLHFHSLVKGLTAQAASKAQLGLGHSYSRAKVKFNVNRADNMIIQSIALLDQLDKDINTFSMRVRYVLASCLRERCVFMWHKITSSTCNEY